MKSYAVPLMLFLAACGSFAIVSASPNVADIPQKKNGADDVNSQHTKWVGDSLREIQKIKRGMTRQQLLQVFREEGGLSVPTQRTYVYRKCDYMKVDVTFELQENRTQHAKDRITKISKPYLAWSIMD